MSPPLLTDKSDEVPDTLSLLKDEAIIIPDERV